MTSENSRHTIALQEILFGKELSGGSFLEPTQNYAVDSPDGWYVFVNGRTKIPEHGEITTDRTFLVGSIRYNGFHIERKTYSGTITYSIAQTDDEFLLIAEVELEDTVKVGERAIDIAVFMFQNRLPDRLLKEGNISVELIAEQLLMSHFTTFLGVEDPFSKVEQIESLEYSELVIGAMEKYLKYVADGLQLEKPLTEVEKNMFDFLDNNPEIDDQTK